VSARLRQAVLVASALEPVAGRLRAELGLGEPFADSGVALFGLHNAVFALGDAFLEVIAPLPGPDGERSPAARHLARRGGEGGGYMVIFQVSDLAGARARAREAGIRAVWEIDLPDIAATHLHPADAGGAIVSIDEPEPPEAWRWGGPGWEARAAPGSLDGVVVEVEDPAGVARRWGDVLGGLPDGIRFAEGSGGVVEVAVRVPGSVRAGRDRVAVGGVSFALRS
jgi:hypothetical protein